MSDLDNDAPTWQRLNEVKRELEAAREDLATAVRGWHDAKVETKAAMEVLRDWLFGPGMEIRNRGRELIRLHDEAAYALREGAPAPGKGQGPDADPNLVGGKL